MTSYLDDDPGDDTFVLEPARKSRKERIHGDGHLVHDPLPDRVTVARIVADGVSFARGGRQILDSVDLDAYAGEALAITGPSGSGKSSLLALVAGLERPDSGDIHVDGRPQPGGVPKGFGLVLQGYGLVSVLTAAENVEVVLQGLKMSRTEVRERAGAALDAVGLDDVADHLVEQLSGGQQQRVAVARALVIDPTVLIADEFTAELDADSRGHILNLVLGVARRGGLVLIATHDRSVADLCNVELRLSDGRVTPSTGS
jgi:putative ABC transport system ATP-binding protein